MMVLRPKPSGAGHDQFPSREKGFRGTHVGNRSSLPEVPSRREVRAAILSVPHAYRSPAKHVTIPTISRSGIAPVVAAHAASSCRRA